MNEKTKTYLVPVAIIVAGLLIAGAIFLSNKESANPNQAGGETFNKELLASVAKSIGLNKSEFEACMTSERPVQTVEEDIKDGENIGIQGTPFAVILKDGKPINVIPGALPIEQLKSVLDLIIAGTGGVKDFTKEEKDTISKLSPINDEDHSLGNKNAGVQIVEFSDMDCPYCKSFNNTIDQLIEMYGDKIGVVYRHFPLTQLHPNAKTEAEATECAAELGGNTAFWQYFNKLQLKM